MTSTWFLKLKLSSFFRWHIKPLVPNAKLFDGNFRFLCQKVTRTLFLPSVVTVRYGRDAEGDDLWPGRDLGQLAGVGARGAGREALQVARLVAHTPAERALKLLPEPPWEINQKCISNGIYLGNCWVKYIFLKKHLNCFWNLKNDRKTSVTCLVSEKVVFTLCDLLFSLTDDSTDDWLLLWTN